MGNCSFSRGEKNDIDVVKNFCDSYILRKPKKMKFLIKIFVISMYHFPPEIWRKIWLYDTTYREIYSKCIKHFNKLIYTNLHFAFCTNLNRLSSYNKNPLYRILSYETCEYPHEQTRVFMITLLKPASKLKVKTW